MIKSWKENKEHLFALIKEVTEAYGGEFEEDYAWEVVHNYQHELVTAIECFKNLRAQVKVCNFKSRGKI